MSEDDTAWAPGNSAGTCSRVVRAGPRRTAPDRAGPRRTAWGQGGCTIDVRVHVHVHVRVRVDANVTAEGVRYECPGKGKWWPWKGEGRSHRRSSALRSVTAKHVGDAVTKGAGGGIGEAIANR
jgi:hypothetical protein